MSASSSALLGPLARELGLRLPVIAAPMFLISNRAMIVACAEAGILGTMPSLNARTSEQLREDLAWIRARTDCAFGINLTLGLTKPERLEADLQVCFDAQVPVLITSYGNPTDVVRRAHERGVKVFHDVTNLAHAKKAAAAGVDAIIAVAAGAGGHAGTISPFVLVPWLKHEVNRPIIAAGGIHGGAQIVASLSLGAALCYVGTRFIASTECGAADAYKERVVQIDANDLVYTDVVSGIPATFIKDTIPAGFTSDRSPDGSTRWRDIWSAGQGVSLLHDIQPIAAIVDEMEREVSDTLRGLQA